MATRNNPILSTIRKIPNFPLCVTLFHIPVSPYWYYRIWFNSKYYVRATFAEHGSTKDETKYLNEALAIKEAKAFFYSLQMQKDGIAPVTTLQPRQSHVFEKVCQLLLAKDEAKAKKGNRSDRLVKDQKLVMEKDITPFFRTTALKDITHKKLSDYLESLDSRNLSPSTLNFHMITIRKILKTACHEEMLDKLPLFPKIEGRAQNSLGEFFEEDQFEALKDGITKAVKEKTVINGQPITQELKMLCSFMVGSFLRVSDIKTLKHSQIRVMRERKDGKFHSYLLIKATSKVDTRSIVTLASAVSIYEDLLKMHKGMTGPDDYVWFPALKADRMYALQVMNQQLNHVLTNPAINLKQGDKGPRTLGSLRSSCIVFALRNSLMDTHTLAVNCRTSEKVITTNYGRHLLPQMSVAKIQSKR